MQRKKLNNIMIRMARTEKAFVGSEFLAPVVRGGGVSVKIARVRCELAVWPENFEGWGVFAAISHSHARLVRLASATQRRAYLSLFPAAALVISALHGPVIEAVAENAADTRFALAAPVAVRLARDTGLFDSLVARFDGLRFWFDSADARSDPSAAAYLRREFAEMTDPRKIERPGLTAGQREAYTVAFTRRANAIREDEQTRNQRRLTQALAHGGAKLREFVATGDAYRVSFTLDGRRHMASVGKNDLTLRSAGICLSGEDQKFDLTSLVGVLREGASTRRIIAWHL